MTAPLPKLAPYIGQLKSGEWIVANLEGTEFWDRVFPDKHKAFWALIEYYEKRGNTRYHAYLKASGEMEP